jgi:hypothetical protein
MGNVGIADDLVHIYGYFRGLKGYPQARGFLGANYLGFCKARCEAAQNLLRKILLSLRMLARVSP